MTGTRPSRATIAAPDWTVPVTPECLAELRAVLRELRRAPLPLFLLRPEEFELDACRAMMARVREILRDGVMFAVVDRLPGLTVVGLTGSSGKTTTKDMIAQLLAGLGPTVAPAGSLNNELGYPYTVLKAGPDTRYLVLEMGARGIGHIRYLSGIARPRIGVVLNVGRVVVIEDAAVLAADEALRKHYLGF